MLVDLFVLFEELVEQHVADLLVVDGHDFTISAPHHELGIHLGDLLGDQTILCRAFPVAVVFEGYWFELVQRFTGLVHRLNVVFELSRRRVEDAHVVKLIDIHWHLAAGVANRLTEDATDKAGVIEGNIASVEEIKALAELPSREGLLSMLLSVLQAPIRNLALATKAVADQKEEQGA